MVEGLQPERFIAAQTNGAERKAHALALLPSFLPALVWAKVRRISTAADAGCHLLLGADVAIVVSAAGWYVAHVPKVHHS